MSPGAPVRVLSCPRGTCSAGACSGALRGFSVSFHPRPVGICVLKRETGGRGCFIRYALCKQRPEAGQYERILCIIHAIVFVIREMPSGG